MQERKNQLIEEAQVTLEAIKSLGSDVDDPLADPAILAKAVKMGILDAPHLRGNEAACGKLVTRLVDGALYAYDEKDNRIISEKERIDRILSENKIGNTV